MGTVSPCGPCTCTHATSSVVTCATIAWPLRIAPATGTPTPTATTIALIFNIPLLKFGKAKGRGQGLPQGAEGVHKEAKGA